MPAQIKVTKLQWDGDHDTFNAGFRVTLECGHTFWRPTNILALRGTRKQLESNGAVCRQGCRLIDGVLTPASISNEPTIAL